MWLVLSLTGFALAVVLHALLTRMGGSLTIVLSFLFERPPRHCNRGAGFLDVRALGREHRHAPGVFGALRNLYFPVHAGSQWRVGFAHDAPESRPTTADELMKSYSTRAMVERRIDHLRAGGFLTETGGQIRLLQRGAALVRVFALARGFFKHRRALEIGDVQDGASGQRAQS